MAPSLLYRVGSLFAGRTGPVSGEQAGKGGHPGDDGAVPEAEGDATGRRVHGRVQAVHRTGAGTAGGTVDGRAAAAVGPAHGRTPGDVRAAAERTVAVAAEGPPVVDRVVVFLLPFRRRQRRRTGTAVGRDAKRRRRRLSAVTGRHRRRHHDRQSSYDGVPKHSSAKDHLEAVVNEKPL